jgi:hypothetical protein
MVSPRDVGDDYKMLPDGLSDQEESGFVLGVVGIRNRD